MKGSADRRLGFTLVEVMIVVAIIGLLAVLAIPAFVKARLEARAGRMLNDLRIAVDAFELYAMEQGDYPPDSFPGVLPTGMDAYTKNLDWTGTTEAGGRWDWERNAMGISAGLSIIGADIDTAVIQRVDEKIDDGVLTSGRFRRISGNRYTYVIAE